MLVSATAAPMALRASEALLECACMTPPSERQDMSEALD
jgi:hypothetical protein